ncbi:1,4-alpha-glucan branching protein [Nocardia sp. NPDC051832]|uniref:maltokinase N-terminal cap-like domain-containing protein n=1 Tax=Nocardia sp. NPDC051832 TaxID=3155673 RepID=UPI0034360466
MAVVHNTTMEPTKLELLTTWLPKQEWFRGTRTPVLRKAGGFRLDDPAGEVGIEFMIVLDVSEYPGTAYHVPMTYRGAPVPGAEQALIGTSEHGVLGTRWIYDGPADEVLTTQALALLAGHTQPQAQNTSNAPDPAIEVTPTSDRITLRINRIPPTDLAPAGSTGHVTATWQVPGGVTSGVVLEAMPRNSNAAAGLPPE